MARRRDEPFNPFTTGAAPGRRGRDFHKKRQVTEEPEQVEKVVDRKALQEAMIAKVLAASEEESPAEPEQTTLVEEELPPATPASVEVISEPSQPASDSVVQDESPTVDSTVEPAPQDVAQVEPVSEGEPVEETKAKTVVEPAPKSAPKPAPKPVAKPSAKAVPALESESDAETRASASRLEDLKRRSTELAVKTGHETAKATPEGGITTTSAPASQTSTQITPVGISVPSHKPKQRRRFRKTKTGGGRQPKQAKLDRRKQLEFRFDIRRILEDSTVAEEHRSNLLGQVWAKGERIGIDAANEYIDQKHIEGIIDDGIADELHRLVRSYTTKR